MRSSSFFQSLALSAAILWPYFAFANPFDRTAPRDCQVELEAGIELEWEQAEPPHAARIVGDLIDFDRIRADLETLTGVRRLPNGRVLEDRATPENREFTRQFLIERLESLGYTVRREDFSYTEYPWGAPPVESVATNLIVEVRGTENPNEVIEVNAHYDTAREEVPGADDNGSGLTTLLELARVYRQVQPRRTIRFVFADLEERHNQGTEEHVRRLAERDEKIVGALVLDMFGFFPDVVRAEVVLEAGGRFHAGPGVLATNRRMAQALAYQFNRYTDRGTDLRVDTDQSKPGTADHGPYWHEGYPALLAAAPYDPATVNPNYHAPTDRIEAITWSYFKDVAHGMARGLAYYAGTSLPQALQGTAAAERGRLQALVDPSIDAAGDFIPQGRQERPRRSPEDEAKIRAWHHEQRSLWEARWRTQNSQSSNRGTRP